MILRTSINLLLSQAVQLSYNNFGVEHSQWIGNYFSNCWKISIRINAFYSIERHWNDFLITSEKISSHFVEGNFCVAIVTGDVVSWVTNTKCFAFWKYSHENIWLLKIQLDFHVIIKTLQVDFVYQYCTPARLSEFGTWCGSLSLLSGSRLSAHYSHAVKSVAHLLLNLHPNLVWIQT